MKLMRYLRSIIGGLSQVSVTSIFSDLPEFSSSALVDLELLASGS